jgi:parallel beta-helix repeat protein
MSDTVYSAGTVIASTWLNDVNSSTYNNVTNLTALKALDHTRFTRANVLGYSTAGDGGGGVYYYDASDVTSTDNGGSIIVATDGGRWKLITTNGELNVRQFGAKGDGSTNDTTALQNAATAAGAINGHVVISAGSYKISQITIPNGVRGLIGRGGTIVLDGSLNAGIILQSQLSNISINGLIIDANLNSVNNSVPIWGFNVSGAKIINNRIVNCHMGYGILLRNYIAGGAFGGGNIVSNNFVQGDFSSNPNVQNWFGIGVDAEPYYTTPYSDAPTQWKNLFTGPGGGASGTQMQSGNVISNNRVIGGYYGLKVDSLAYSTVSGNTLSNNVRGISLQNNATGNVISGNSISSNESAGIHLAYGSSDNLITGNQVITSIGAGEALIQAYVGCQRNTIVNNYVESTGTGNQYGIYVAVHASYNTIKNNTIRGTYTKASLGVESAWRTTLTSIAWHYGNGATPSQSDNYANAPTVDVNITGNTIYCDTTNHVPSIFVSQVKTINTTTNGPVANYDAAQTGVVIQGNTNICNGGNANQLYLYEDTNGSFSGGRLIGNQFALPDSNLSLSTTTSPGGFPLAKTYFNLPRGRAHFLSVTGNDYFNSSRWSSVLENSNSLLLNHAGETVSVSQTSSGYVLFGLNTDDGATNPPRGAANGQIVHLRMDVNTDVTHTGATVYKFQLANAASIQGSSNYSSLGAYNAATAYTAGQVVTYAGSNWYCIFGATGVTPGNPSVWRKVGDSALWLTLQVRSGVGLEMARSSPY